MTLLHSSTLRTHWFLSVTLLVIAVDVHVSLTGRD